MLCPMTDVFLIGGGRDDDAVRASHRPFVAAAGDGPIVAVVLDEGDETDVERWRGALALAGATAVRPLVVSKQRPPVAADFDGAAGVFVAGGWTPGYHEALVEPGTGWLPRLPFAGFSAGAALASTQAILGGHRVGEVAICAEEAGEDLEQLTVRPGLGLVPFAVDVHATQWGTLTRLVHAVRAGAVHDGLAVDEGTVAVVRDGALVGVEGLGAAYRVSASLQLEIVRRW
jgi:cyanophycinase